MCSEKIIYGILAKETSKVVLSRKNYACRGILPSFTDASSISIASLSRWNCFLNFLFRGLCSVITACINAQRVLLEIFESDSIRHRCLFAD